MRRDLERSRTKNFEAANFSSKNFGSHRADFACNPTHCGMPTLDNVFGDVFDLRQVRESSGGTDFGAISSSLEPKILRSRNFFENFSVGAAPISHAIPHAAACGRLVMSLGTCLTRGKAGNPRAARISARSQAISDRKFCGRKIFFRKISVRTAPISHAIPHAAARL